MVADVLLRFIYPPSPEPASASSLFISTMSAISFVSLANGGFREIRGNNMQYSKFWNNVVGDTTLKKSSPKAKVSGRTGMILVYSPAFLAAGFASIFILPNEGFRFSLLCSALTIHFFKRLVEVLFVHKFSSYMDVETAVVIATSYFLSTVTTIYGQYLTRGLPEPAIDLKYAGIGMFVLGICGNLYHHILLSKLRKGDERKKEYKIPEGGLFGWIICPHYLFEIVGFFGICCISQTVYSLCWTMGTTFYLVGRSYATWKWYHSKFVHDFPKNVKALVPYIF